MCAGNTLPYTCLNGLGPRRSGSLFALNAPITAVALRALVLGARLSATAVAGIGLTLCGVLLAIPPTSEVQPYEWATIRRPLGLGVHPTVMKAVKPKGRLPVACSSNRPTGIVARASAGLLLFALSGGKSAS